MRRDAWRNFVDRPGGKLFVVLLAGVLSLLVVLGYQYLKLSQEIDRQTEAGPYPQIVDMHLAFSLPVSLGAKPPRVPSGAGAAEPGPDLRQSAPAGGRVGAGRKFSYRGLRTAR